MPKIVTLDGIAGAGKGTLGKKLAGRLGLQYLDTGLMYRNVALKVVKLKRNPADAHMCVDAIARMLYSNEDFLVDTSEARSEATGKVTAAIAAHSSVRSRINGIILDMLNRDPGSIIDGRAGASEFPDADLKIFITASDEACAMRRYLQLVGQGESLNYDQVLSQIRGRNRSDRERQTAPMVEAVDAIVIDTSEMNAEEVYEHVFGHERVKQVLGHLY